MKKQVIFANKEEVGKVPGLWKFISDEGEEFSTFKPDQYPLGEPIAIEYTTVETGQKKQFKQNRLVDKAPKTWSPPEQKAPYPVTVIPNEVSYKLDKIITMLESVLNNQNPL